MDPRPCNEALEKAWPGQKSRGLESKPEFYSNGITLGSIGWKIQDGKTQAKALREWSFKDKKAKLKDTAGSILFQDPFILIGKVDFYRQKERQKSLGCVF